MYIFAVKIPLILKKRGKRMRGDFSGGSIDFPLLKKV